LVGTVLVGTVLVGTVLVGTAVVDEVLDEGAAKATIRFAEGASRYPSPTLGVGKWFSGTPIDASCRTAPVEASSPYNVPFCPMVQTKPAATIGGPPPTEALQSRLSPGGETVTATVPLGQGR
jgi:hypothetical protein